MDYKISALVVQGKYFASIIIKRMIGLPIMLILFISSATGQIATVPAIGDGTSTQPYQIATLENLFWVAADELRWDKYYLQTADIDAGETNTWYSDKGWIPIGNDNTPFSGSYNGQGYSISNLYIDRTTENIGLFGWVDSGVFTDIKILDCTITGDLSVGGLAGYVTGSEISGCSSTGSLSGFADVGGLIGFVKENTSVTDCFSDATVDCEGESGGFIGIASDFGNVITNCYSTGDVTGGDYLGGFIGSMDNASEITKCYSTGNVVGENSVGGFIGYNDGGMISKSYSNCTIAGTTGVGGFVGFTSGSISDCFSIGDVSRISGSDEIFGGFCGEANSNAETTNSYCVVNVYYIASTSPSNKGFMGHNAISVFSSNFFDKESSNQTSDAEGTATGKTTSEMKTQSTFTAAGWDFTNTWKIDPLLNDGYPYFQWVPVCTNPDSGGEIGEDQSVCSGTTPEEIENVTLPSGHTGDLKYKWQSSITSSTTGFADIPGAGNSSYLPGPLTATTWFRRLTRVDCMPDWTGCDTSNVVKISIVPLFITTQAVTSVASISATGNGNLTSVCSNSATNRGVIFYPYTDTDKVIGGADVTNVSESGTYGTGAFIALITGLAPNTRYHVRAHATNSNGTAYGDRVVFWTLANIPLAPTVNNFTLTSLDVTINTNSNPDTTTYAIQDSITGKYVQTSGTLGDNAAWQKASVWGTKTVTGLTTGTIYTFRVKAKNANNDESEFGLTSSGIPSDVPATAFNLSWAETRPAGNEDKQWKSVSISADGQIMLTGARAGRLYKSTDGGNTLIETRPDGDNNRNWSSVAVSSDAKTLVAANSLSATPTNGRIYISADLGENWTETKPFGDVQKDWQTISMSGDGKIILAGPLMASFKISTNGGQVWTTCLSSGFWRSSAVSSDGSVLLAGEQNGRLNISVNGGVSWNETRPAGAVNKYWKSITVSADGSTILAAVYGGRIYKSGNSGTSWTEVKPAGDVDKNWSSVAVSADGLTMLAAVSFERIYRSYDGGETWNEIQPAGNADKQWETVALSGNADKALAAVLIGRIYKASVITSATDTTATVNASLQSVNGANASSRGAIIYPFTDMDKIIGDAGVINLSSTGNYGIGDYSVSFTGLLPNTHYNARIHATNSSGTGYSDRTDFWTLASIPSAPTVNNPSLTTLDVTVNTNSNPDTTTYAIQDSITGKYVQTGGTLDNTAAWQKASVWGTKTVTGLTTGTIYTFRVKARNSENIKTAFSPGTDGLPSEKPTVVSFVDIQGYETRPDGDVDKAWASVSVSDDGSVMLAGTEDSRLYLTANGGNSWTETKPAGDINKKWRAVAVSGDKSTLLASVYGGRLYNSTDVGASWNETTPAGSADQYWNAVSVSENGLNMLAGGQPGRLYYSDDSGVSWTENKLAGDASVNWSSVSLSGDGTKMLASVYTGRLFISTNSAGTWTELKFAGDEDKLWNATAISPDGNTMLAGVSGGRLYLTTDGGTTWNETQPAGNFDKDWNAVTISQDGKIIVVNEGMGRLHYSTNQGAEWIEAQPLGDIDAPWYSLSMTGDASKILVGMYPGRLLIGVPAPYSNIAQTTTTATGDITFVNGENATNRGFIWYPYTGADKIIGDTDVTINLDLLIFT